MRHKRATAMKKKNVAEIVHVPTEQLFAPKKLNTIMGE